MAVFEAVKRSITTLGRRDFWSFQVVHAVLGGVLTFAAVAGAILMTERIKKQISEKDTQIIETVRRLETLERTIFQLQISQNNGLLLNALSSTGVLVPALRSTFGRLAFTTRKTVVTHGLRELYRNNDPTFLLKKAEYDKLVEVAASDANLDAWMAVLTFEIELEAELLALRSTVQQEQLRARLSKSELESRLDATTIAGFVLQQLGFFIILLAGLVHQHGNTPARTSPPQSAPPSVAD